MWKSRRHRMSLKQNVTRNYFLFNYVDYIFRLDKYLTKEDNFDKKQEAHDLGQVLKNILQQEMKCSIF